MMQVPLDEHVVVVQICIPEHAAIVSGEYHTKIKWEPSKNMVLNFPEKSVYKLSKLKPKSFQETNSGTSNELKLAFHNFYLLNITSYL